MTKPNLTWLLMVLEDEYGAMSVVVNPDIKTPKKRKLKK